MFGMLMYNITRMWRYHLEFVLETLMEYPRRRVAVNLVVGNWLEPRFMGRGLGLSTLVVFISLVFWGWIFGPVGMFLSTPLTMLVKIALESDPRSRWLAVLLSAQAPADTPDPS